MSRTLDYRRFQEYLHSKRLRDLMIYSPGRAWWNDYTNRRYIKRYYYGNAFYKKLSRRKFRRFYDECVPKGNHSNRYYDYWWSIT